MAVNGKVNSIYAAVDMTDIVSVDFPGGIVCAFTTRMPGKATPNEDAIALIPCGSHAGVLAVADGLGGQPAGDQASGQVLASLALAMKDHCADADAVRNSILNGVEQADSTIAAMGIGAATTVSIVDIHERDIRSYHVGDSMMLVTGQRGRIKYQTVPHSPVGYAVEAGMLDADAAMHHKERHLVSNAVGIPHMRVEIGPRLTLAARDTLLIGSDGVFDNLQIDEIVELVRKGPLATAAENLRARCQARMAHFEQGQPNKPDDMSFILYRPG